MPARSRSASARTNPMSPMTTCAAVPGSANSASTTTARGCTGPPWWTSSSGPVSASSSGAASATVVSVGRLSTSPIAPSSVCSVTSTTVRWKFGSRRVGAATSSAPRRVSIGSDDSHSGPPLHMASVRLLERRAPPRLLGAGLVERVLGPPALLDGLVERRLQGRTTRPALPFGGLPRGGLLGLPLARRGVVRLAPALGSGLGLRRDGGGELDVEVAEARRLALAQQPPRQHLVADRLVRGCGVQRRADPLQRRLARLAPAGEQAARDLDEPADRLALGRACAAQVGG